VTSSSTDVLDIRASETSEPIDKASEDDGKALLDGA
jgi:hypothetical protein